MKSNANEWEATVDSWRMSPDYDMIDYDRVRIDDIKAFINHQLQKALTCGKDMGDGSICGCKLDCHLHDWRQREEIQKAREETIHRILAIVSSKQNQFTSTYERGYQDCVKNILESIHHYQSKLDKPN